MELILTVNVEIEDSVSVRGESCEVNMISFGGTAKSGYFNGKIIGTGVDTQKITGTEALLSARYMLEGSDYTGAPCRIFIENNGADLSHCTPHIVTDSKALSQWESAELSSTVEPCDSGVTVKIYKHK